MVCLCLQECISFNIYPVLKLVALTVYLEVSASEAGSCVFRDVKSLETLSYKFCGVLSHVLCIKSFLGSVGLI